MEESHSETNGHSVYSEKKVNHQPSALERLKKTLQNASDMSNNSQDSSADSSVERKLSSSVGGSETRDLWKLVRRLAENRASSSNEDSDGEEQAQKPEAQVKQRRFNNIPSIVERLRSSNITDNQITANLSEEEREAERKRRLAVKWKTAVRTASAKSHTAPPSLMNDIKTLEHELDEFKDELRQYHQISLAFTPPQYQRNFVVREMDELEYQLALQKEKNPQNVPSSSSTSVRSSIDTKASVDVKASFDTSRRRNSISSPRSPRPQSGKSASSDSSEPKLERPKSANNPRGYGSRWFLPVDAWSSFEKPQQPDPVQEEEVRIAFKRMDNINYLHSSKAFKQFLLENEQRLPHFLDTTQPIPKQPNANAALPSTSNVPSTKSTSPQMLRRRKSISGPPTRPSTSSTRPSTSSSLRSTTSSVGSSSSRITFSPPPSKRQLTFSPSITKTTRSSSSQPQRTQTISRSASVGSLKRQDKPLEKPRITTTPA